MKKKIIYSSALTAILSVTTVLAGGPEIIPVIPDYFTGFFVGPVGGVTQTLFDVNASTSMDPVTLSVFNDADPTPMFGHLTVDPSYSSITTNGGTFDGFVGVEGGLGITVAHQYYLGVNGFGEWGKSTSQQNGFATLGSDWMFPANTSNEFTTPGLQGSVQQTVTTEFSNKYGVFFKPGWLVTPTTMVFGEIGGMWANVKVTNSVNYSFDGSVSDVDPGGVAGDINDVTGSALGTSDSGNKTKTALLLGVGFETFVFPQWFGTHLTLGADYRYANFGSVETDTNVTGTATRKFRDSNATLADETVVVNGTSSAQASVKVSEFNGFAHFYFGNDWF